MRGKEFSLWGWNFRSWPGRIFKSMWWVWEGALKWPGIPLGLQKRLCGTQTAIPPLLWTFRFLPPDMYLEHSPALTHRLTDGWSLTTLTIFSLVFHCKIFRSSLFLSQGQNIVRVFFVMLSHIFNVKGRIQHFFLLHFILFLNLTGPFLSLLKWN